MFIIVTATIIVFGLTLLLLTVNLFFANTKEEAFILVNMFTNIIVFLFIIYAGITGQYYIIDMAIVYILINAVSSNAMLYLNKNFFLTFEQHTNKDLD